MAALFSSPDIPKPVAPSPPKTDDGTLSNAANAERLRRLRSLGKQQSIFAGELSGSPTLMTSKLGGGM